MAQQANPRSALQLRRAIGDGRIGVEELTQYYLDRIKRYGGTGGLNAVAALAPDALAEARRMDNQASGRNLPLYGLPILVKDNIDVAGLPTTAGSLALADNIALQDAPVVANLRRQGALILGKTNLTEFAHYTAQSMPGGYSSAGGQVKSAYGGGRDPGGSSTGSAVAMAAGLCAAAVGTDTQFSVIGCAADNGVTGLKPAHGALRAEGIVPISHTLDSVGALTWDFADALAIYSGMRDCPLSPVLPTPPDKLRIAVNWQSPNGEHPPEQQTKEYEALFVRLREAGAHLGQISHAYYSQTGDIMRCEFRHDLEEYLATAAAKRKTLAEIIAFYETDPAHRMKYGDDMLRAALEGASGRLDDPPYLAALEQRGQVRVQLLCELREYDACVMAGVTNIMHFAGLPSVALKMGSAADGSPLGVTLYGVEETRLFAAALTVEQYCLPVAPPRL